MAGWNKYLSVQLHLMQMGYRVARDIDKGDFSVSFMLYGRMRQLAGWQKQEALQPVWHSHDKEDSDWLEVRRTYIPSPGGWHFLLNGRNVTFAAKINPHDIISIFPPGR